MSTQSLEPSFKVPHLLGRAGLAGLLCLIGMCSLAAETVLGKIIVVKDGDTVVLLDEDSRQHTLRLAGIDAPEKKQAFGQRSKQSLSDLAYAKSVSAEISKIDKYGRSIAVIFVEGRDVNLEQVRAGMAWHYKEYQAEQSEAERLAYAAAENEARQAKLGLWVDEDPVPPWEWRHRKKSGK